LINIKKKSIISYCVTQDYNVYLDNKKVRISIQPGRDLDVGRQCYSQPAPSAIPFTTSMLPSESEIHSFSQPTQVDDLLLSSQLLTSQTISTSNVIKNYIIILTGILYYYVFRTLCRN